MMLHDSHVTIMQLSLQLIMYDSKMELPQEADLPVVSYNVTPHLKRNEMLAASRCLKRARCLCAGTLPGREWNRSFPASPESV